MCGLEGGWKGFRGIGISMGTGGRDDRKSLRIRVKRGLLKGVKEAADELLQFLRVSSSPGRS